MLTSSTSFITFIIQKISYRCWFYNEIRGLNHSLWLLNTFYIIQPWPLQDFKSVEDHYPGHLWKSTFSVILREDIPWISNHIFIYLLLLLVSGYKLILLFHWITLLEREPALVCTGLNEYSWSYRQWLI